MLNYKNLHSKIEEQETNAIYYLLRKFGLLQETIILSKVSSVTGKYGVYTYDAENNTLVITNAEPTTNYKVIFTILDADNNARTVSVTGKETNGSVNITVPTIATDELLLEKIKVIITYVQEIVQDYIVDEPSEVIGTGGEYITIADLSNNDLPDRFILSFDYKSNYESRVGLFSKENFTGNPNYSVFVGMPTTSYHYYGFRTTSTQTTDVSGNIGEYSHFTIERDRDVFKYARNGNVLGSKTITWFDNYNYIVGMMQWGTDGEHSVKNVQMVALPDRIDLGLIGDKDIIQSSETATVTATLTKNGVVVTGETLNYEILHNGSVISSGSVVTDGNGEAEITYTGTGVGEVNITVEYGIFLQETYEVLDAIAYDKSTNASDFWTYWTCAKNSANTVTVDNTGTLIETDASQYTSTYMQLSLDDFTSHIDVPIVYELDIISLDNYLFCYPIQRESNTWWASTVLTGHIKIIITSNNVKVYQDGVLKSSVDGTYLKSRCYLQSQNARGNGSVKFKNLRIYRP